jgi:hypothetical protein
MRSTSLDVRAGLRGSIVCISSSNGWLGSPGVMVYAFHYGGVGQLSSGRLPAAISGVGRGDLVASDHEFGGLLRSCRERARLTQTHLAHLSGLGVRTIRELEQGRTRRPHPDTARLLADALGIHGADRREFERQAAGGAPAAIGGLPLPGQLPAGAADFTGRAGEVTALHDLLTGGRGPTIVTISGGPGVGKTALAVHVARQARSAFPDGQLFADLQGSGATPAAPGEVLGAFLRALGIDGSAIPEDSHERAALFRSCLADARALVVLDAAADEAQVRPLLPGGVGCAALVTSRGALACLEGSRPLRLGPPGPEEAVQLLAAVAGSVRVAAEPEAAAAVAERCGRLPLALRAAGARLRARPHWRLARLADRLEDEGARLAELAIGDLAVRTQLDSCYAGLSEQVSRAVQALASLGGPDFDAETAARRLSVPHLEAEQLLERLVDAWLLEVAQADGIAGPRYRFPELLRVYCRAGGPVSGSAGPPPSR